MKRIGSAVVALLCTAIIALAATGCFGSGEGGDTTATTTTVATTTTAADTTTTTARAYPFTGYVNATTLNVRPTADTSGEAIGGLKFGDTVTVIDREGDWYKINFRSGIGYVSAQYVQDTMPASTTSGAETTTAADTTTTTVEVVVP